MLLAECAAAQVQVKVGAKVTDIRKSDSITVEMEGETFTSPVLVLATGGLSIPKMGATGLSYDIAKKFGLKVITPRPALVPLKATPNEVEFYKTLSGVSLLAIASCGSTSFKENILFTHRGLSGPAILQISSYWREGQSLGLDLAPGLDALKFLKERKLARPKAELKTILAELLPQRLAQALSPTDLPTLAALLKNWTLTPDGSEGFAKAEVTAGGIDTNELSSKTMEAKAAPGLYAIGEAVDVTGWLGGYNFPMGLGQRLVRWAGGLIGPHQFVI
jgi:predicted Rossmann fold flavoprotein